MSIFRGMNVLRWPELGVWVAGFIAGEVSGTYGRVAFPPPPSWIFAASLFVSLAGIAVLLDWFIRSLKSVASRSGDIAIILYAGFSLGCFLAYIVLPR